MLARRIDALASPARSLWSGLRLPLEGMAFLRGERQLWPLAALPVLLSLVAFAGAVALVVGFAGELHAFATGWLPSLAAERWWEWIWVGPAWALRTLFGGVLFAALAAVILVGAFLLASLLASPVLDALAARVERIARGEVVDQSRSGALALLREGGRAALEEARRLLFFAAVSGSLVLLGVVIPGAQLLTAPALLAVTIFFLPLDYASYALDRRRLSFAQKRRWLLDHRAPVAGFGLTAFGLCAVPGLSFVAMPVLVVAGTLLALRLEPVDPTPRGDG